MNSVALQAKYPDHPYPALAEQRARLNAAYAKGFDAYLINHDRANNLYQRADFRKYWQMGRDDCKANKKPRY